MKIWIVAIADFPEGRGATPRLRNIGLGLLERGHTVRVLLTHAAGYIAQGQNAAVRGEHRGLAFEYVNGTSVRPSSDLGVALAKLVSSLRLAGRLFNGDRPDVLWLYSHSMLDTGIAIIIARLFGVKIILDVCDEHYDRFAKLHARGLLRAVNAWQSRLSDRWLYRVADAFVVVSGYLEQKVKNLGRGQPLLRVPLVADMRPPAIPDPGPQTRQSLAYVGTFTADEGLETLLEALQQLRSRHPELTCTLYGAASHREYEERLRLRIQELELSRIVEMGGMLDYDQIIPRLRAHSLLVLPRMDSIISRAGFPGKLSEYLSADRPIVATPFGDFPQYFREGESAYVSPDFSVRSYSDTIERALHDQAQGRRVAARARQIGESEFHYTAVARSIEGFIADLLSAHPNAVGR